MFPMNTIPAEGILFVVHAGIVHMIIESRYYSNFDYYATPADIDNFMQLNKITLHDIFESEQIDYDSERDVHIYFMLA